MSKDPIIKNVVQAERMGFSRRLREALAAAGNGAWTATQLANGVNSRASEPVSYAAVRKWLIAEAIPTQRHLVTLALLLECEPNWLRFGSSDPDSFQVSAVETDVALLEELAALDPPSKRLVRVLIDAITAFSH